MWAAPFAVLRRVASRLRLVVTAAFWALRFEAVIRRRRIDDLARLAGIEFGAVPAGPGTAGPPSRPVISPTDLRTLRVVAVLYRAWPRRGTCLRECLVAGRLLRYRRPVLRVGVQPGGRRLQAHAWLEFDGIAIDPTASEYAMLALRS